MRNCDNYQTYKEAYEAWPGIDEGTLGWWLMQECTGDEHPSDRGWIKDRLPEPGRVVQVDSRDGLCLGYWNRAQGDWCYAKNSSVIEIVYGWQPAAVSEGPSVPDWGNM